MAIKKISTDKAPAAIGPYSQGCIAGNFAYFSGQGGIDPATSAVVEGGIEAQAECVMQNIKALLDEVGAGFPDVVKTTCFLQIWTILPPSMRSTQSISPKNPLAAAWR